MEDSYSRSRLVLNGSLIDWECCVIHLICAIYIYYGRDTNDCDVTGVDSVENLSNCILILDDMYNHLCGSYV